MTTQELAYAEIERLMQRFKDLPAAQRKGMNEMQTRLGYILPLFRALGWDTSNINEVSPEEKVSRGWVDFSFRVGNVPRFFLETKRAKEDLNNPDFVKQAIDYAWTKSVTWALLSDFEGLRVFNAEWKEDNPFRAMFFEFSVDDYLSKFDKLWWLSREETGNHRLDKEADKVGKRTKRLPVTLNLFDDLKRWRTNLFKNYKAFNPIIAAGEIDTAVLRLLNRLIFIRTAEDREVEDNRLRTLVRVLKDKKQIKTLDHELAALFRQFDETYNSELFARHFSEELQIPPTDLEEIIEGLYEKNFTRYNFNALDADVLGTAYEQYLGHVMAEGVDDTSTTLSVHVEEKRTKRKSQGIYYTPTFVTKYIVQQTVGKYLDEHGYNPSKPLRVLDMACGSGSFLIEAFDVIDDFVAKQRGQAQKGEVDFHDRMRQLEVLQNCIYGVDKDKQAVEVARLNLLLRGLHSREKLPMLENIAYGNSLRPETTEQVFSQAIKDGGFDIIVGNPPYIRAENMPREDRDYYINNPDFEVSYGRFDIFILFLERAIKLLKNGGRLGFIIPYAGLTQNYSKLLRKFVLDNCVIDTIVDFSKYKVFEQAEVSTCILILRKETNSEVRQNHIIEIVQQEDYSEGIANNNAATIRQTEYENTVDNMFRLELAGDTLAISQKIDAISLEFGNICYSITGVVAHDSKTGASKDRLIHLKKSGKNFKPYIEAKESEGRYSILSPKRFIEYRPDEMHRPKFPELFENPKILIPDIIGAGGLNATLDLSGIYTNHSFNCCVPNIYLVDVDRNLGITQDDANLSKDYAIEYLLGVVNSSLITYYFSKILGGGMHASPSNVRHLPIRRIDFGNPAEKAAHDEVVKLVEKMLALQKERQSVRREDDLDRVRNLEREIVRVDEEIDRRVYVLYGLTEEEIKIVEGK